MGAVPCSAGVAVVFFDAASKQVREDPPEGRKVAHSTKDEAGNTFDQKINAADRCRGVDEQPMVVPRYSLQHARSITTFHALEDRVLPPDD